MIVTRPNIDLAEIRRGLTSAVISDILDGLGRRHQCLGTGLAPLDSTTKLVGWAFNVAVERVQQIPATPFRGLVAALDSIGVDEVFITPTQRATDIAVWGELLSTTSLKRGAAGALTDGLVRDSAAIIALNFPVIAAGTIPYDSLGRHEIRGSVDRVVIDGIEIAAGDLVVGDRDGVVVVPVDMVEEVVHLARDKRRSEIAFRDAVAGGMPASQAFSTFGVL